MRRECSRVPGAPPGAAASSRTPAAPRVVGARRCSACVSPPASSSRGAGDEGHACRCRVLLGPARQRGLGQVPARVVQQVATSAAVRTRASGATARRGRRKLICWQATPNPKLPPATLDQCASRSSAGSPSGRPRPRGSRFRWRRRCPPDCSKTPVTAGSFSWTSARPAAGRPPRCGTRWSRSSGRRPRRRRPRRRSPTEPAAALQAVPGRYLRPGRGRCSARRRSRALGKTGWPNTQTSPRLITTAPPIGGLKLRWTVQVWPFQRSARDLAPPVVKAQTSVAEAAPAATTISLLWPGNGTLRPGRSAALPGGRPRAGARRRAVERPAAVLAGLDDRGEVPIGYPLHDLPGRDHGLPLWRPARSWPAAAQGRARRRRVRRPGRRPHHACRPCPLFVQSFVSSSVLIARNSQFNYQANVLQRAH